MIGNDRRRGASIRRWLLVAGAVIGLVLAWALRGVLVPLFCAFLIAYALDPLVDRLAKLGVSRGLGAAAVVTVFVALVVVVSFFAVPFVVGEFEDATQRLPEQLEALKANAKAFLWAKYKYKLPATWGEIFAKYGAVLQENAPTGTSVASAVFGTFNAIFLALGALIVPVLSVYLLIDFDRLVVGAERLLPRRHAPAVHKVVLEIHRTLGNYVRGQLLTNGVLAALYATGLSIVGVRLAVPIGVLTGLLSFVPYVGLATGTLLAVVMAVLDWQSGAHVAATVGVMVGVGVLDGMVITPRIVGGSVGLKPIEVLLMLMAAGTLFGFLGVLLAVPLGAVVKILVRHGVAAYLGSRYYAEVPRARGEAVVLPPPDAPVDPPAAS